MAPAPIEDASASSEVVEQCMVAEEFTGDNDMSTPTMKKKRRNIEERYVDLVADVRRGRTGGRGLTPARGVASDGGRSGVGLEGCGRRRRRAISFDRATW